MTRSINAARLAGSVCFQSDELSSVREFSENTARLSVSSSLSSAATFWISAITASRNPSRRMLALASISRATRSAVPDSVALAMVTRWNGLAKASAIRITARIRSNISGQCSIVERFVVLGSVGVKKRTTLNGIRAAGVRRSMCKAIGTPANNPPATANPA